jgi:hypothetical protein
MGDRMRVRIEDVSILRRQITASRVVVATKLQRGRRNKIAQLPKAKPSPARARSASRPSATKTTKKGKQRR